jgi:hypothetical protein
MLNRVLWKGTYAPSIVHPPHLPASHPYTHLLAYFGLPSDLLARDLQHAWSTQTEIGAVAVATATVPSLFSCLAHELASVREAIWPIRPALHALPQAIHHVCLRTVMAPGSPGYILFRPLLACPFSALWPRAGSLPENKHTELLSETPLSLVSIQ